MTGIWLEHCQACSVPEIACVFTKAQVTGVVRDAAGNPMIGVTVTIKGTLVGVSTGVDGSYTIPADKDAMLLFSYIGYRNQEELVGQRTQIDVTMQEDQLMMDEVVVVGYGTLKKRNIVGAVENLAGDAVENRPNADITRSLQGQIPGLNIVQTDGKAAHGGQVTIRGVNNSFKARVNDGQKENKLGQGGSALVLIDGAEGDMSSVNPDDIASISVLKDASSAAVYGARGAFGVILITTKNPEKGKVRVNYNGSALAEIRRLAHLGKKELDPADYENFLKGYAKLSAKELEICEALVSGLSTRQCAERAGCATSTVDTYRKRVYEKTGIHKVRQLQLCVALMRMEQQEKQ